MQPDKRHHNFCNTGRLTGYCPNVSPHSSSSGSQRSVARTTWLSGIALSIGLMLIFGSHLTSNADESTPNRPAARGKKGSDKPKVSDNDHPVDPKASDDKKTGVSGPKKESTDKKPKVIKTEAEWKKILKPEQFRVTRLKETEAPFINKLWNNKRQGKYLCVCCGEELYRSEEKFESGTGWPSFWAPTSENAIGTEVDYSGNSVRTEAHCDRCGAHLGHIFDDGPAPTGMRHCINSASLKFVAADSMKAK